MFSNFFRDIPLSPTVTVILYLFCLSTAVYPDIVLNENTDAIWLIASENLLRKRLEQNKAFQNASNQAKENYLCRSLWHNGFIYDKCVEYGCKYIIISGNETIYDLSSKIIKETNLNLQG